MAQGVVKTATTMEKGVRISGERQQKLMSFAGMLRGSRLELGYLGEILGTYCQFFPSARTIADIDCLGAYGEGRV